MTYENCASADACGLEPSIADICGRTTSFLTFMSLIDKDVLNDYNVSGMDQRIDPVEDTDSEYDFIIIAKMTDVDFTSTYDPSLNQPGLLDLCPVPAYLSFMTAMQNAILENDVISGFRERVRPIEEPYPVYDFVVVGGGAGGSVVASRLSENPKWNILLLEAGHDEPAGIQIPGFYGLAALKSDINWSYKTNNETNACLSQNGSCTWASARMLGGCTAHNAMTYLRGNPTDYNNWADLGNEGWTWQEVEPYFLKAEDNGEIDRVGRVHHSTGGPLSVERFPYVPPFSEVIFQAATELGYNLTEDFNGDEITGFGITQTNNKNGVRRSSAAAYLRPIRHRNNLHISLNSTVTDVIIENDTATGVRYYKNGELKTIKVTKEVILSAGSKRSPHLLLLSGVGPKEHLESVGIEVVKDLPGVGENLHDHPMYILRFQINDTDTFENNWEVAKQYLADQTGPLASVGLLQVMGMIATSHTAPDYPNIQMMFIGYNAGCAPGDVGALRSTEYRSVTILVDYLHPKSRGKITLASKDPLEYPAIWANYYDPSTDDLDRLVDGVKLALKFADAESLKAWNFTLAVKPLDACSRYTFLSTDYWKCALSQSDPSDKHDVGTCKMGPQSDPMAVVDPKLRVYGIKRLRVVDASIMPRITSGNTGAPTMMIGERGADFIKADYDCFYRNYR